MDAEPSTSVAVERVTEPFSGMRLVRVTGYWQGASAPPTHFDVRLDGETVTRCEPVAVTVGGQARVNFGTQFPEEHAGTLAVVAVFPTGEHALASRPVASLDTVADTPRQPGFLGRVLRSVASGEVVSPTRWAARLGRAAARATELREKVQGRLLARRFRPRDPHLGYAESTAVSPRLRAAMTAEIDRFRYRPTFSILVPVYLDEKKKIGSQWLRRAVESVRAQVYPHWELCLADDASTDPDLLRYLDRLPADPRIKLVRRAENGHICRATNSAADLATGEFVSLLDHDDELAPHALFAVAERLQTRPDADLIYSDEDKVDAAGRRYDPQFKPDWSPELLLSYNYVNHFTTIRRAVFEAAGRFRPGFEGSQDHDLLLRVTERTDRVEHIPQVLYHWRSLPDSTATAAGVKTYVHTSGRRAVAEALTRRGIAAELYVPPFAEKLGLPVLALDGPDDGPGVAVIVSGEAEAARRTVRSLRQTTAYRGLTDYLVIDRDPPAERLNRMAAGRTEDLLLFLEAGCEPTDPRWLSRLVANLGVPGIGAVGGRTVDATGAVLDAGIVTGMRDGIAPAPAFAGLAPNAISYYFYAEVTRNVSAVSGRCLLTRRDTFEQLGGFDARRYPHSLWDVDYSLRVRGRGLRCAVVAGAELRQTGGAVPDGRPTELLSLKRAYGRLPDAFHNPNCSERVPWEPGRDAPLSLPAEATRPAVRALVVAHNLNNPEGAPRYLSEIVLGLRDRGAIAPVVVSPLGGPGAAVYADAGIPVAVRETPQSRRFVDGLWTPAEYRAARRTADAVLRRHCPEVVIANTLTTFPLVEAAARAGIPAVWIIHESYSRENLVRLFPPFARARVELAFALATRVVPASHDTAALFARLNTRGNVRVIHNGLDPAAFPPVRKQNTGPVRFLAVGTICERKGQHTLIEAAARLARERTDFACDLVGLRGGIPYADYCRELVRRHGLGGIVNLVPETDRVTEYLRAADVFVCTSHMETFSRAVLEAEAFGLPILSTPVHGVPEQVFWGANALRFEFGDAAGLAGRMRDVLANPGLRGRMATESRAAFDLHLTQSEMLDRYAAVILSVARQGPRGRTPLPASPPAARRAA
ncbi:MAG: glycosyltransferase [Gemmataceae bacterium]